MKALNRLDVYILGDRLHAETKVEELVKRRLEEKEQILRVSERSKRIVYGVKKYRKKIEPAPNAPLLKRIVKNPRSLDPGYSVRKKLPKAELVHREQVKRDTTISEYLKTDKKIKKMRPMQLHLRASTVERPTVESWAKRLRISKQKKLGFDFSES
ncbi:MAG: hypothetical protein VX278_14850 [Myxococcota bacterium]|nr:hypothetical protein [Myxococcota bacterium]